MSKFGIDISRWQKGFDFAKATAEGVKFTIIKCSQKDYKDTEFENHYNAAKAHGLPVGAYHFCTARTVAEAKAEAQTCINAIKGKQFEFPIFLDFENSNGVNYRNFDKDYNSGIIKTFCEELENAGYWAGFYCNYDFYKNVVNGAQLAARFSLWLASWSAEKPVECQVWQFGGETNVIRTNKVAGVTCDQNYSFVDFPVLIKGKGLNGFKAAAAKPVEKPIQKGDKVKIKQGASDYNGKQLANFVYGRVNDVFEVKGDRAVVTYGGVIVAAVNVANLERV